ncbi:MAG: 2-dehydropantoate 2-reductase [Aquificae bacterium]|nr:2-dehydropantoate 2-reductase [Aquificota bacterium]
MNIVVFGLGALGVAFATFLKEDGHKVYGITKEKYLPYLKDKILKVEGIWGEHEAKLDGIYSSVDDIKENIDLILLTVKSYDTEKAVKEIKKIVSENTYVLVAQNGYGNYEIVSKEIGKEHTLLARVIFGSKVIKPGHVKITVNADDVRIGDPSRTIPEEEIIKIACAIKHAGIPASYDKNVYKTLWDKILYNSALNPLGALLECSYGTLAENKETKQVMDNIIEEIFTVAKAHNIELNWNSPEEYKKHFYENLIPPTKDHFPSMYYDIKEGKKTEIDALNGAIVKLAKEKGIKVPVNETVVNLLKTKEKLSLMNKTVS